MNPRRELRQLARRPAFAFVALLTLALGIGAPTAVFSVVRAVLLRPLPYPGADRLVRFRMDSQGPAGPVSFDAVPAAAALEWASDSQTLSGLALFDDRALTLSTAAGPFRLTGVSATPNLFEVLRVAPEAGRTFDAGNAAQREIVLSHATWTQFFAGNPAAVGSTVSMDGEAYRVVGVMPAAFRFPSSETAFWVAQVLTTDGTRGMVLPAVARVRPGAPLAAVEAEGRRIVADGGPFPTTLVVQTLQEQMTGGVRRLLWVLLGAVGFVTVIATSNLALLLLTRGAGREREFSIRAALGADRRHLVQQLVAEGGALGAMGGIAGLGLAWAVLGALVRLAPANVPRLGEASIDGTVLLFAVLLTVVASVVFGVLSAGRALAINPWRALSRARAGASLGATSGPRRLRLNALAVVEVALTMVLLVAAGLLGRSFVALVTLDQGFNPSGAVAWQVNLPAARYPTADARLAFDERLLDRVQHAAGVAAAGISTTLPSRQPTGRFGFSASPSILADPDPFSMPVVDVHTVSDGFMEAMGLRLLEGRTFNADDRAGAEPVIVISERFARQQFPRGSAVNAILYSPSGNRRVVGVVADVRPADLGAAFQPDAYVPLRQQSEVLRWFASITVVARGADPRAIAASARSAMLDLDSESPPYNVRLLDDDVAQTVAGPQFSATVLAMFAMVALAMACVGVYGVMAYSVSLRTREIGVRLAIGATRSQVMRLVLKDGGRVMAGGLALGLASAVLLSRSLTGLLYEVTPADGVTMFSVVGLLTAAGTLATWFPARRATRVDPLRALKDE